MNSDYVTLSLLITYFFMSTKALIELIITILNLFQKNK